MLPSEINLGIAKVVTDLSDMMGSRGVSDMSQKAKCLQHWHDFGFEGVGTGLSGDKHGANEQCC